MHLKFYRIHLECLFCARSSRGPMLAFPSGQKLDHSTYQCSCAFLLTICWETGKRSRQLTVVLWIVPKAALQPRRAARLTEVTYTTRETGCHDNGHWIHPRKHAMHPRPPAWPLICSTSSQPRRRIKRLLPLSSPPLRALMQAQRRGGLWQSFIRLFASLRSRRDWAVAKVPATPAWARMQRQREKCCPAQRT